MSLSYKYISSPVGRLTLIASDKGLSAVLWENEDPQRVRIRTEEEDNNNVILIETERQLKEYFDGKRKEFSIQLDPVGTDFQKSVWNELSKIPYGETRSYLQIANQLNNPGAIRAVGAANGKNPIAIIVPCHRVIGSSGDLIGFAGGLDAKSFLLSLEGVGNKNIQLSLSF